MSAHCGSCGSAIEWVTMNTGSLMPIDALPDPAGNLAVWRDDTGELRGRVVTADKPRADSEQPGMSHFATCPDASKHRKRRRG